MTTSPLRYLSKDFLPKNTKKATNNNMLTNGLTTSIANLILSSEVFNIDYSWDNHISNYKARGAYSNIVIQ